jgi:hypothetical protein
LSTNIKIKQTTMTIKEAKKELIDYFGLDMTDHAEKKLESILSSIEKITYKKVIEKKYVYVSMEKSDEPVDLLYEAERVSALYGITVDNMRGKSRDHICVGARAHLVREMRFERNVTVIKLAEFLNRDHSTIIHLTYASKANCLVKPLKMPMAVYK